jgi:hypothetical protein
MLAGFVIGCLVGCVLGVFATCLVVAAKEASHSFQAQRTRAQKGEESARLQAAVGTKTILFFGVEGSSWEGVDRAPGTRLDPN